MMGILWEGCLNQVILFIRGNIVLVIVRRGGSHSRTSPIVLLCRFLKLLLLLQPNVLTLQLSKFFQLFTGNIYAERVIAQP